MTTYIDWMRSCWYVTFMANPAISVPGRVHRERDCRSASRSSDVTATSGACCSSRTRSSRPRSTAGGALTGSCKGLLIGEWFVLLRQQKA